MSTMRLSLLYDRICFLVMCFYVTLYIFFVFFFFSSRRRHTRSDRDWSSDVCSSDLLPLRLSRRQRSLLLLLVLLRRASSLRRSHSRRWLSCPSRDRRSSSDLRQIGRASCRERV